MNSVLIICIGNICRSPMAEGIFSAALPDVQVRSAGIGALIGRPADPMANELMKAQGLDISSHIARQVNEKLCRDSDLILVMDRDQRKYLETKFPFVRGKVFRLAESLNQDVPDPYRLAKSAFDDALALINAGAVTWIERIKKIKERERQTI